MARSRAVRSASTIVGLVVWLAFVACEAKSPEPAAPVESESEKLARIGREKLAAGDKKAAKGHFKAAIQADKEAPHGRYGLAVLHILEGNTPAAQQELLAIRTAGKDVAKDAPWLAALLDGRKHFPVVVKTVRVPTTDGEPQETTAPKKASPTADDDPETAALFKAGKFPAVVDKLAPLTDLTVFQLKLLADAYYNLQDWTRAVTTYRRVLRKEPGNEPVTQYLADALFRLKRFDESITFYRVLAEANPKRPGFWRLIGDAATAKKDWEVALASYKKAVANGYDDPSLPGVIQSIKDEMTKAAEKENRR